jgi:DNA polymerase
MVIADIAFHDADYSAIEARVLAYLAQDEKSLAAYREGIDVYKIMASKIYGCGTALITASQRQLGKQAVLGCGYGLGHKKFKLTCEGYGIAITPKLAEIAVNAYRENHPEVVNFWRNLEEACISAVQYPNSTFSCGYVAVKVVRDWLFIRLPSGRKLHYYKPHMAPVKTPWGEMKNALHYTCNVMGKGVVESTYGGALVENCTQAVARDIMAYAMLELDTAGFDIVLTVHDEILREMENADRAAEFVKIMESPPDWAKGIPLNVGTWIGQRYKK